MNGGKSLIERAKDAIIVVRDKLTGKSARRKIQEKARSRYTKIYERKIEALEAQVKQRAKDFLDGTKFGFVTHNADDDTKESKQ